MQSQANKLLNAQAAEFSLLKTAMSRYDLHAVHLNTGGVDVVSIFLHSVQWTLTYLTAKGPDHSWILYFFVQMPELLFFRYSVFSSYYWRMATNRGQLLIFLGKPTDISNG